MSETTPENLMTFTAEEIALAESRINMMPFEQIVKSLMFGRYLAVNERIDALRGNLIQAGRNAGAMILDSVSVRRDDLPQHVDF